MTVVMNCTYTALHFLNSIILGSIDTVDKRTVICRGTSDDSIECIEVLCALGETSLQTADQQGRLPMHYVFGKIGALNDTSHIDPVALCAHLCKYTPTPCLTLVFSNSCLLYPTNPSEFLNFVMC